MINALLGDVWVYVGAALSLASLAAFPFLLQRYRACPSIEAPEQEPEQDEPVIPAQEPEKERAQEPAPERIEARAKPEARVQAKASMPRTLNTGATMPGGISPAVVYLQNLKLQIEHFEKEIHELRSQVVGFAEGHDRQFKALLDRMSEMQSEIHSRVETEAEAAPKPQPEPEPEPEPESQPEPEPQPVAEETPTPIEEESQPEEQEEVTLAPPSLAADEVEPTMPLAEPTPESSEPTINLSEPEPAGESKPSDSEAPASPRTPPPSGASGAQEVSEEPAEEEAPAQEVPAADSPAEDEDILKPTGKGPVWPV